jgi:hypothetical protein
MIKTRKPIKTEQQQECGVEDEMGTGVLGSWLGYSTNPIGSTQTHTHSLVFLGDITFY